MIIQGLTKGTLRQSKTWKRWRSKYINPTISKNLFHGSDGLKFILLELFKNKEWIITIRLERQYTKQEIIVKKVYLNQVDFVNGAVGIRSAAKIYMNKNQKI